MFLETNAKTTFTNSAETAAEEPLAFLARERYDTAALEAQAMFLIENCARIEHDRWQNEPEINARTALFEELTAKGHLSHISFDEPASITNSRTLQRLINGWSDDFPDWEKQRRFYEIVEELIIQETFEDIKTGRLSADTFVITISDYPEMAEAKEAHSFGYRPLNEKGMVRGTYFKLDEDLIWKRSIDQISRSNSTDKSSYQFIARTAGYDGPAGSRQILANQILGDHSAFPNGIVDVQRIIDEQAGQNVIYGEDRNHTDLNVPEYNVLREVSAWREDQAHHYIQELADIERRLNVSYESGKITYYQKLAKLKEERTKIVDKICLISPSYAKDARGEESAWHYEKAALAMAAGNDTAGMQHFAEAIKTADPMASAVCGGAGIEEGKIVLSAEGKQTYLDAKEERKKWKWSKGICLVKECPSRPAKTEVGPCSVCRKCQAVFDNGDNPKNVYKTLGFLDLLFESIRQFNEQYEAHQALKRAKDLSDMGQEPPKKNMKRAA